MLQNMLAMIGVRSPDGPLVKTGDYCAVGNEYEVVETLKRPEWLGRSDTMKVCR